MNFVFRAVPLDDPKGPQQVDRRDGACYLCEAFALLTDGFI